MSNLLSTNVLIRLIKTIGKRSIGEPSTRWNYDLFMVAGFHWMPMAHHRSLCKTEMLKVYVLANKKERFKNTDPACSLNLNSAFVNTRRVVTFK